MQNAKTLITAGTILNVAGAILNALHLRGAFLIWILSNTTCAIYFLGAARGYWVVDTGSEEKMVLMYLIFIGTSLIGLLV